MAQSDDKSLKKYSPYDIYKYDGIHCLEECCNPLAVFTNLRDHTRRRGKKPHPNPYRYYICDENCLLCPLREGK